MEFLNLFLPYIKQFIPNLINDVLIFIITMAFVYSIGRLFMLTNSDRIKNSLAFFAMLGCNYFLYQPITVKAVVPVVIHMSICVLLYVLIGFKLYDRVDSFLDTHFGKDKRKRK